ncbi:hypothetical protein A2U01_0038632, partial [Trifolium medium]|nr:hypothetical protein [Trifolium medium]
CELKLKVTLPERRKMPMGKIYPNHLKLEGKLTRRKWFVFLVHHQATMKAILTTVDTTIRFLLSNLRTYRIPFDTRLRKF